MTGLLGSAAAIVAGETPALPRKPAEAEWPEFRGPTRQGHATGGNLPLEWSTTKNVIWKQPVPGAGWSSPVVSGRQVFLTSGIATGSGGPSLRTLCLDRETGALQWDTEVFGPAETTGEQVHDKNSPASPTPIVEGERLYVHFGHNGTAGLDRAGRVLWRQDALRYDPEHGSGGSPILVGDRLVFSGDGRRDPFVVALDKATGEVIWKVPRVADARQKFSFCTALLIAVNGQPQIISPGSGAVSAFDPKDGRELWRVRYGQGYSVVPRPVFAHGLLFIATGFNRPDLLAIRPDGEGDVTDTHIAWRTTKGAPLTPSVVVVGDELYAVNDAGIASCWDAKTGQLHWQERLEGNYSSSPLAAEGRIYFQNERGTTTVIEASREFRKLATNHLEERTLASYAVAGRSFFIRTEKHLYRIGHADGEGR
ncbi:MAG: PQQ-like beta-propeller repeat protein [Opitutaceae bacterium]|nr:PQQ-like beta-propeller repeat protein [Opitutaceae bacterium]